MRGVHAHATGVGLQPTCPPLGTIFGADLGRFRPYPGRAQMRRMWYLRKDSTDSGSAKHCTMPRGTIGELIPSFRSQIDCHDEQMCDIRHFGPLSPTQREGGQMVKQPYLRTTAIDFTSENCPIVVSVVTDDDGTTFRSEIDNSGP